MVSVLNKDKKTKSFNIISDGLAALSKAFDVILCYRCNQQIKENKTNYQRSRLIQRFRLVCNRHQTLPTTKNKCISCDLGAEQEQALPAK